MLIALPNQDGSFTVTLFLSFDEGKYNFNNLTSNKAVIQFFEEEFPDALRVIPNIIEEFNNNPTATLGTVKCHPWYYRDKTLLIGDAAHAKSPTRARGMTAGFEDALALSRLLGSSADIPEALACFERERKPIVHEYQRTSRKQSLTIGRLHKRGAA